MSNIGTSFDSWLEEEDIKEEVEANAWKKVIAWQIQNEMKREKLIKTKMVEDLHTGL